jgi:hypothetical protein
MRTFKEMAETARIVEPSQRLGSINYCHMIAELAEGLHRLEYNLANQLVSLDTQVPPVSKAMRGIRINQWLEALRADLP